MARTRLYAEGTDVPATKSQQEIAALAERYGAEGYMMGWQGERAVVEFTTHGRRVRFVLLLAVSDAEVAVSPGGTRRPQGQWAKAREAEVRRRWRTLALAIKAKFDVVESGIASFEDEFLAQIVLPSGATVASEIQPRIAAAYESGQVGPMLELGGS